MANKINLFIHHGDLIRWAPEQSNPTLKKDVINQKDDCEFDTPDEKDAQSLQLEEEPPKDKWKRTYILFYILGMCSLLPFSMFITASTYYMAKLNGTGYEYTFENYFSIAYFLPSLFAAAVTIRLLRTFHLKTRLMFSSAVMILLFTFTAVLVKVDTSQWKQTFFVLTLITVILTNAFGAAVYTSSLYGLAGVFPKEYSQAVVTGQAVANIFATSANVISLALADNPYDSALGYFCCAIAVLFICFFSYFILRRIEFARFYMKNLEYKTTKDSKEEEVKKSIKDDETPTSLADYCNKMRYLLEICKKIWPIALSNIMTTTVTASIFPALAVLVRPIDEGNAFLEKYYVPLGGFMTFSITDFLGGVSAVWVLQPRHNRGILLLIITLCRIGFIPFFWLCNAYPRSNFPVLIHSDAAYVIGVILLGLSNGYILALTMMYGPRRVDPQYAESAAAVMNLASFVGFTFGSVLSFGVVAAI